MLLPNAFVESDDEAIVRVARRIAGSRPDAAVDGWSVRPVGGAERLACNT